MAGNDFRSSGGLLMLCVNQKGIALVLVLWVIVLLGVIAGAMSMTQRTGVIMVSNLRQEREARALADAGLHFMMLQLDMRNLPREEDRWPVDGKLHPWVFGGNTVWIGAVTENARLDLNQVDEQVLTNLLQSFGLEDEALWSLRDAILDWRDPDNIHRDYGAEDAEYRQEGRPLGPRDGRFLTVEELRQVKGITPEIYEKLAAVLTVNAQQRTVNPAFASRAVLSAIPGMTPALVDQYLQERQIAIEQGQNPPVPPAGGRYFGSGGINSNIFRIIAEVDASSGMKIRTEVVISTKERTLKGYRILSRDFGKGGVWPRANPVGAEGPE